MSNLFVLGDFKMHSGGIGHWKIECDSLTDDDLQCLAFMLKERLPQFGFVFGVPRGGLRLAKALEQHKSPDIRRTLIVDDVLTTGKSMEEMRARIGDGLVFGAVLFARGECPDWVTPLFRM